MSPYIYFFIMLGMLIWLFPPIRQYGTRFFIFFLMFGLADFSGFLYTKYIDAQTNHIVYIIAAIVALISLQEREYIKKYFLLYSASLVFSAGIFLVFPNMVVGILLLLFYHILILITIFKIFLNDFFRIRVVSIFLAVLLFYEITTVTKLATLFTGFVNNFIYYGTTTTLQIILGLFFSIIRYDYKRFILQLR